MKIYFPAMEENHTELNIIKRFLSITIIITIRSSTHIEIKY